MAKTKMSKTAISVTLCINGLITGLLVNLSLTITTAFESIMNPTKLEEKPKIIDYGLKRTLDNWNALCNDHYYLFTTRIKNNNRKTFLLPTSKWTGRKGKHKLIINSQNPRKLAPYEIEATGTYHMMAPYLIFILKNCFEKGTVQQECCRWQNGLGKFGMGNSSANFQKAK